MSWYGFLADLIVAFHFAYVAFIPLGLILIIVGACARWRWVRNPWFRLVHFLSIGYVAFESVMHMECPLTTWEYNLRELAGQQPEQGTFIGRWAHRLLFWEFTETTFMFIYISVALLVLATLVFVPPRWRRKRDGYASEKDFGQLVAK